MLWFMSKPGSSEKMSKVFRLKCVGMKNETEAVSKEVEAGLQLIFLVLMEILYVDFASPFFLSLSWSFPTSMQFLFVDYIT